MKSFKMTLTLLAAGLMAYSPVTIASMNIQQKNALNRNFKYFTQGTFNDFHNQHGNFVSQDFRGFYEAWLKVHGDQKMPKPQLKIVKDQNGNETLQVIMNHAGKALTMNFSDKNRESFTVNGVSIRFSELSNMSNVLAKLSEKDSSLRPLAKAIQTQKAPPTRDWSEINARHIAKLTPLQRVTYFSLMRESVEAAQKVLETASPTAKKTSFFIHPLIAAQMAWAQNLNGKRCMVAGNLSIYENNRCNPVPSKQGAFSPQPGYHNECTGQSGKMVACNPIIYGFNMDDGKPHCLASDDQPEFTLRATEKCGIASPLKGSQGSAERLESYRRILESYAIAEAKRKGKDSTKIGSCFTSDNKIKGKDQECAEMFKSHVAEFQAFKQDAASVCNEEHLKKTLKDQRPACKHFMERELELAWYMEQSLLPITPVDLKGQPVGQAYADQEKCQEAGGTLNKETFECICDGGYIAKTEGYDKLSCEFPRPLPEPKAEKDKCRNEKGEKRISFECNPALWLIGGALLAGALAWLFGRDKDPQSPPPTLTTTPPGVTLTTMPPVLTPTTLPPIVTPTTMPPAQNEQGSGTNNGPSGGVRTAPKGAK